ncbi:putative 2OG Fe(II) oxygenase superfamily [Trypanosoma vivax]|uniref:Fe2OG dioxygenase domain-containing protein n=1 Tax=Trypanosoma vivax (strain Y486) TaxID=1055687 RepID=G0TSB7_TRYVY|nr:hypothetical protein TRVL_04568 [Trypanosoma vivax]KAH8605563.1 putative 2OG Fe(II) oxygenase superfamily [Trypanosoma vivax]CCC46843.1 conserved hypothetical protein [Trypanosoma vivax Y486]
MRRTLSRFTTLVKIGRGAENVTEFASNSLLEALQLHGYCYVQHPFIQPEILQQVHRDSRVLFERYMLDIPESATDSAASQRIRPPGPRRPVKPMTPYELESIRTPTGFRGYYRYLGAGGPEDAIECFSVGREVPNPAELREPYYKLSGWQRHEYMPIISRKNAWDVLLNSPRGTSGGPSGIDAFMADYREMMLAYYDLCSEVALDVLRHISCGLGVRPTIPQGGPDPDSGYDLEFFTQFHNKLDFDLQTKYYPQVGHGARTRGGVQIKDARSASNPRGVKVLRRKSGMAQEQEGAAAGGDDKLRLAWHKDLSTITLLSQDALGGFEVWDSEEEKYNPVPVLNDALLVNAGVFLEKWTGGLLEATPHRVRSLKDGNNRCSVVFFCLPNHDARVEPLLQQDENPSLDAQEGFYAGDMMPASQ